MKKLLVIIPTYNESATIKELVLEVFLATKLLPAWQTEVLVVDDTSPDGTSRIIRTMQTKNVKLHLLTGKKSGLGKAYLRGFDWGLKRKEYDAFVMMDGDFSHDPNAIPSLISAIESGADYAIGSRYVKGGKIHTDWPLVRNQMSRSANKFANLMLDGQDVSDLTAGFKAILTSALAQLNLAGIHASGYVFQVNLLHEFSRHGFKIVEIPITFSQRRSGTSKMRLSDITEFFYLTYRLDPNSRVRRIVRFGLIGTAGAVVNIVLLLLLVRGFSWQAIPAAAVAIELSIISNFCLNYFYTFKAAITSPRANRSDSPRLMILKLFKFNLVLIGSGALSFLVFLFCYSALGLTYLTADIIAIIIAMSWNYWLNINIVWKLVDD